MEMAWYGGDPEPCQTFPLAKRTGPLEFECAAMERAWRGTGNPARDQYESHSCACAAPASAKRTIENKRAVCMRCCLSVPRVQPAARWGAAKTVPSFTLS